MSTQKPAVHLSVGTILKPRELDTVSGSRIRLPDSERLVHLQFRRFAGCPVCNMHLCSFAARHAEIVAAGIHEVVVFHSTCEEVQSHAANLPFDVVADPGKTLYARFGVGASPRAVLNPRAWPTALRAVLRSMIAILRSKARRPALFPHGGRLGLPADFLIAPDGRLVARKYGNHAADQWSVDELLTIAAAHIQPRKAATADVLATRF